MYDRGKMDGADKIAIQCQPKVPNCPPANAPFQYVYPARGTPRPFRPRRVATQFHKAQALYLEQGALSGELCREFGISRKTGYKIFDRYQECWVQGLTDRSRRPYRYANQLPFQVENFILNVKRKHASWGARKIRERLLRRFTGIPIPAKSTIHAVLDRHGLVERRGQVRRRAQGIGLSFGKNPNELWCTWETSNTATR
jgi:hypothetical protein